MNVAYYIGLYVGGILEVYLRRRQPSRLDFWHTGRGR